MGLRLVYSDSTLPIGTKKFARCALPSAPPQTNFVNRAPGSTNLQERHARTFAALHELNPRLADIIEGMTLRYLRKEREWPNEDRS